MGTTRRRRVSVRSIRRGLLDTRGSSIPGAGVTTALVVANRGGVPADARAVTLNVTSTGSVAGGFATVYPCGMPRPDTSNLNFAPGQTVANAVTTKVGVDGSVCIYNDAPTHLIVDVSGYYPSSASFGALDPARLLDTRGSSPAAAAEDAALVLINQLRASRGLGPVSTDATMHEFARNWSVTMSQSGFRHSGGPYAENVGWYRGSVVAGGRRTRVAQRLPREPVSSCEHDQPGVDRGRSRGPRRRRSRGTSRSSSAESSTPRRAARFKPMSTYPFTSALVTGASSGIGAEIARLLGEAGVPTVLVARRGDRLREIADRYDGFEVLEADLGSPEGQAITVERIASDDQPVDLVVNNAGFGTSGVFHELDVDRLAGEVELNVKALTVLSHAALSAMVPRGRGYLLNVSSVVSFQAVARARRLRGDKGVCHQPERGAPLRGQRRRCPRHGTVSRTDQDRISGSQQLDGTGQQGPGPRVDHGRGGGFDRPSRRRLEQDDLGARRALQGRGDHQRSPPAVDHPLGQRLDHPLM